MYVRKIKLITDVIVLVLDSAERAIATEEEENNIL